MRRSEIAQKRGYSEGMAAATFPEAGGIVLEEDARTELEKWCARTAVYAAEIARVGVRGHETRVGHGSSNFNAAGDDWNYSRAAGKTANGRRRKEGGIRDAPRGGDGGEHTRRRLLRNARRRPDSTQ